MSFSLFRFSHQSHQGRSAPARLGLACGQALSWTPRRPAVLRVSAGRVWVTLGTGGVAHPSAAGDRFLEPGETLVVPAGCRVVLEPVGTDRDAWVTLGDDADRPAATSGAPRHHRLAGRLSLCYQ